MLLPLSFACKKSIKLLKFTYTKKILSADIANQTVRDFPKYNNFLR